MNAEARQVARTPTQDGFDRFLQALDPDRQRAGEAYQHLRLALEKFFRWRGGLSPQEHADEVLDRVMRRLSEGEVIADLRNYCYGVARRVFAEVAKRPRPEVLDSEAIPQPDPDAGEDVERRFVCLEGCMQTLSTEDRQLIVDYHRQRGITGIRARAALGEARGINANTLRIRAHRIRRRLETCVRGCTGIESGR